jgi:hypothetical protein
MWHYRRADNFGRCPSLSEHESESILRTYLVCREKQANCSLRSTQCTNNRILLPQRLSCYWGESVSRCMLTNLRLADFVWPLRNRDSLAKICRPEYTSFQDFAARRRGPSIGTELHNVLLATKPQQNNHEVFRGTDHPTRRRAQDYQATGTVESQTISRVVAPLDGLQQMVNNSNVTKGLQETGWNH